MAQPTATGDVKKGVSMLSILILAMIVHLFDAVIRLPGGRIDFYIWTVFFVLYAVLAIMGNYRFGTWKGPVIASALAAFVIPFAYTYVARSSITIGMLMLLMPTWIIYLLIVRGESYPWLSFFYLLFWIVFLAFSFMPQVQTYASTQGYELPTISPGIVLRYTVNTFARGFWNAYQAVFVTMPEVISKEVARSIAVASGDYYTGSVDQSAEQRTGVYMTSLRLAQAEYYEGEPATVFATISAASVAQPINVHLSCIADPGKFPAKIEPETAVDFTVVGSTEQPVDCIFTGLPAKQYSAKLTADFNFATRSYQKVYFMEAERLNEYKRRGVDPLDSFPDKKPGTIYSPGPLMIGMTESFPTQPIGITQGKSGPIIGITVDNLWGGETSKINDLIVYTPKGLEVKDINGIPVTTISCNMLREEEIASCDDSIENIYRIPPVEIQKLNSTNIYTYRAHTTVTDSSKLLGNTPVSIKNIKVTVDYDYRYSTQIAFYVRPARA